MPTRPVIIGIGEVLWDMLPAGKQLGGAPANFAYHAKALGADAYVVSRVGDDELGHEILRRLDALGVNREHVTLDPDHPTGTVDVRLDDRGVPSYVIHDDVAWDFIPQTPELLDLARRADAVCFGTLAQRSAVSCLTLHKFLRPVRPTCRLVYDINLRQSYFSHHAVYETMRSCDVLKLNDAELPAVAELLGIPAKDTGAVRELMNRCRRLELVALTRGPHGSAIYTKNGVYEHPGVRTKVADTVGAGDAFTAALVMGLLEGHDPDRINAFANRLAAYVCSQAGATPPIPTELLATR